MLSSLALEGPCLRFFGWVAMVILILTLGPLLHGLCLLAEEMLNHANTRHRGRGLLSHVLPACGLGGKTLLAAGLAGLLLYLVGHPLRHDGYCWKLLFLSSVLYPLFKSLGVLGPSEVEVSDICEGRKMNVAHGLAWSFYLGYLRLVLPRLEDSITAFCATHQSSTSFWGRGNRKLLILIPLNANISHKLEDEDDSIRFYDNLPNNEIDRAGVRGRVYKHSVYRVQDEDGKGYNCAVEYATPLLTLYNMSQESRAGFGEPERRQQVLLFYTTLQDILENSLECRNRYKLILLNDEHEDDPHFLSKAILRHLQQQEKEEFCLSPPPPHQEVVHPSANASTDSPRCAAANNVWCCSDPMSREPTLMFSLDKPQPLRQPLLTLTPVWSTKSRLLHQDVTRQIEHCLTKAKASTLHCQVLLLPRQMTIRVGQDVVRSSAEEPCGLRGASIKVYVEQKDALKSVGSIIPDPSVTPTFELSVIFKAEKEDGWPPLMHIFDTNKVLKLRPEYRLVKRKLYSSASPVVHDFN
ncbi:Stimulator of interferon genes protein [Collichthys lucidus]|uniref:Stimulator of interferon genes protein n=1 Tax=Collichthys lucidus TaxID=240159 RepID=A0A4U5UF42_COLLU|nr:Stimulator of interferon genes protein [Collichthys lucidus]